MAGANRTLPAVTTILIGYARCSTDRQDLAAQQTTLGPIGVIVSLWP
jgi:hypothetical protein